MHLKSVALSVVAAVSVLHATVCFSLTAPVLARTGGKQLIQVQVKPGKDIDEPDICGVEGGASFWFAYVPDRNGTLYLDTEGSDFDTLLGVFIDNGLHHGFASLTAIACDDDGGSDGITSALSVGVTNGLTYYIMLDGKNGASGQAVLNYAFDNSPSISSIPNQTIKEEQRTVAIPFVIGDIETNSKPLQLAAYSSDTNLVPTSSIVFGGKGTNRTVTVIPAPYHYGTNEITVWVCDDAGNASSSTFELSVAKVDHKPTAKDDKFTRLPSRPIAISLAALTRNDSDVDGDIPVVLAVSPRSSRGNAIVVKSASFVTYTAPTNYNLEDKFTYTISDGKGGTATATVTITVSSTLGQTVVY